MNEPSESTAKTTKENPTGSIGMTQTQVITRLAMSPAAKGVLVIFLTLCLAIPLMLIDAVVDDRQRYFREATDDILQSWGGRQSLVAPMLVIPRRDLIRTDSERLELSPIVVMPRELEITGTIDPSVLERGMFQANVYSSQVSISGRFDPSDALDEAESADLLWDQAHLVVGLSDARSLGNGLSVFVDGQELAAEPAAGIIPHIAAAGFQASPPTLARNNPLTFDVEVAFNGTDALTLLSLAEESRIDLSSSWPDPSFIGGTAPSTREVSDEGFRAEWTLSAFGRQLPLATPAVSLRNLSRSSFWSSEVGVRLYEPASLYQQVERSVKYGVLLIALTFVGLLLIEFAGGVRIHLMQYGLVGLSLCVFYLLYLSLSEHIGLVLAYAAGALAVVGQVGLFLRGILGRWRPAVVLAALLCGLYAGFYLLLGSADYALLIGSLALFFGLGAVMYATRKIDWSGLSTPAPTKAGQSPAG